MPSTVLSHSTPIRPIHTDLIVSKLLGYTAPLAVRPSGRHIASLIRSMPRCFGYWSYRYVILTRCSSLFNANQRARTLVAGLFVRGNIGTGIFDTIRIGPKRRLCGFTALSQKRFYA